MGLNRVYLEVAAVSCVEHLFPEVNHEATLDGRSRPSLHVNNLGCIHLLEE
jgi:hypothetical protein